MVVCSHGETLTATKPKHQMITETVSPTISKAIESVAFRLAEAYLANLRRDTENTLGTLESLAETFKYDLASSYYDKCADLGVRNTRFRLESITCNAKYLIRDALRRDPALASKLIAIRDAQRAKVNAEISAEQARWVPVA